MSVNQLAIAATLVFTVRALSGCGGADEGCPMGSYSREGRCIESAPDAAVDASTEDASVAPPQDGSVFDANLLDSAAEVDDACSPDLESCNGLDDDCDGSVDEEGADPPEWYGDADGDGHGDEAVTSVSCVMPIGYAEVAGDCDDADPSVHPDATESCNGIDDDCSGTVDDGVLRTFYGDADGDGYGTPTSTTTGCSAPDGYVPDSGDCDDACAECHPGRAESCDSLDNDCDGIVDQGNPEGGGQCGSDVGACSFGTDTCVSGSLLCVGGTGPSTETCNGTDDDCDGTTDEGLLTTFYRDSDGDDYGLSAMTMPACSRPSGYALVGGDCDDACPSCYPGGAEVCDGADNDCDGTVDEPTASDAPSWYIDCDGDGFAATMTGAVRACTAPAPTSCGGGWTTTRPSTAGSTIDCRDSDANVFPGQTSYFTEAIPGRPGDFDYDCDGAEERQSDAVLDTCPSTCASSVSGWSGIPPVCGEESTWRTCSRFMSSTSCSLESTMLKSQGCR